MGICTRRHFLLSICLLQLISTVERQVFDFLGYMWIPILINFFEIIFVIFGFFGAFQYRPKYVLSYSIWNFVVLAWNIFLICLYLDIGILQHQESKVLKLDPGSSSWWGTNGPGCQETFNEASTQISNVTGCVVDYIHIEVFHASVQCFLALLGVITGLCLSKTFLEEDDSFEFLDGDSKNPQHLALQPMYVSYTNLPLSTSSFPSCRSSLQSNRRSVLSDSRNRASRNSDIVELLYVQNSDHTGGGFADMSVDSRLPLNSYGQSPEMKRVSHARYKPKPGMHVDQIRKFSQETRVQRTKSFDKLLQIQKESGNKTETVKNPRPKSLYTKAF